MSRFPIGGPRQPVYDFLRNRGFVMSHSNDKHWTTRDGLELHLYGTGSMARITDKTGAVIADDTLEAAVAKI